MGSTGADSRWIPHPNIKGGVVPDAPLVAGLQVRQPRVVIRREIQVRPPSQHQVGDQARRQGRQEHPVPEVPGGEDQVLERSFAEQREVIRREGPERRAGNADLAGARRDLWVNPDFSNHKLDLLAMTLTPRNNATSGKQRGPVPKPRKKP